MRVRSIEDLPAHLRGQLKTLEVGSAKRSKYGNEPWVLDGHHFDSKAEARRWQVLAARRAAGEITELVVHPTFDLHVGDVKLGTYTADFRYREAGVLIVEDVKSEATARKELYRWKRRHLLAEYGICVQEVSG